MIFRFTILDFGCPLIFLGQAFGFYGIIVVSLTCTAYQLAALFEA
jgi:hypothetical protein